MKNQNQKPLILNTSPLHISFKKLKNLTFPVDNFNRLINISHCVKSFRIRSYSGPYFPAFGLSTERYFVFLCIQSERGKIRTRITPNTDTFHAVSQYQNHIWIKKLSLTHFMPLVFSYTPWKHLKTSTLLAFSRDTERGHRHVMG